MGVCKEGCAFLEGVRRCNADVQAAKSSCRPGAAAGHAKVKGKSRNSGACLRVQPFRQGVLRQLDVYFCMVCGCAVLL
jgi:hypothetical protein